jgi:hypothetical protein
VVLGVVGSNPIIHPKEISGQKARPLWWLGLLLSRCPILGADWEPIFVADVSKTSVSSPAPQAAGVTGSNALTVTALAQLTEAVLSPRIDHSQNRLSRHCR